MAVEWEVEKRKVVVLACALLLILGIVFLLVNAFYVMSCREPVLKSPSVCSESAVSEETCLETYSSRSVPILRLLQKARRLVLTYSSKCGLVVELSSKPLVAALFTKCDARLIVVMERRGSEVLVNFTFVAEGPAWVSYPSSLPPLLSKMFNLSNRSRVFKFLRYKKSVVAKYLPEKHTLVIDGKSIGPIFFFEEISDELVLYNVYWQDVGSKPVLKDPSTPLKVVKKEMMIIDLDAMRLKVVSSKRNLEVELKYVEPAIEKLAELAGVRRLEFLRYYNDSIPPLSIFVVEKNTGIPLVFPLLGASYMSRKTTVECMDESGRMVRLNRIPVTPLSYLLGIRSMYLEFRLVDVRLEP